MVGADPAPLRFQRQWALTDTVAKIVADSLSTSKIDVNRGILKPFARSGSMEFPPSVLLARASAMEFPPSVLLIIVGKEPNRLLEETLKASALAKSYPFVLG